MQSFLVCNLIAIYRIILTAIITASLLPIIFFLRLLNFKTGKIKCFYMRVVCRVIGIKLIVHGELSKLRPLLIASNHLSYIDVLAYGSLAPIEFVSKKEVSGWPFIGILAKLADTVFIDRSRSKSLESRKKMDHKLNEGNILLFFPEATSNDGTNILPFKSSLFDVVKTNTTATITLQPSVIAFTRINNLPIGNGWKSLFSWYGEIGFIQHLWRFLRLGCTTVEISLLEPIKDGQSMNRKLLKELTEQSVKNGMSDVLSGRKH